MVVGFQLLNFKNYSKSTLITSSYVVYSLVFRFETKTKSVVNHLTVQKAVLTILTFVFTFTTYTQLQDWTRNISKEKQTLQLILKSNV